MFVFVGWQVLGRTGPLPLILLPQFGGYWIEGTNHDLGSSSTAEEPPPCPASQVKLETNSIAKIYRKHFLGKVRFWIDKDVFNYSFYLSISMSVCLVIGNNQYNWQYYIENIDSNEKQITTVCSLDVYIVKSTKIPLFKPHQTNEYHLRRLNIG